MIKNINSIEIDLKTMQIFQNGIEIKCPFDVWKAYGYMTTYEYLEDNYCNDDEDLWKVAQATRDRMYYYDDNITEVEAIDLVCKDLNIELVKREWV